MPYPVNATHKLLLEDNVSYLLLEDNTSKLILDETVALDSPLNAATVSGVTPALDFQGQDLVAGVFDDFGGIINATLWAAFSNGLATVTQSGGVVAVTPGSATATVGYAGYDSRSSYNLTSTSSYIQIAQAVNAAVGAQQYFKLILDGSNAVQWILENGTLKPQKTVATATSDITAGVTFNASTHKWWRIRESLGTTYFDFSSDGATWTNHTSLANPFTMNSLSVEFAAGTYQSVATPGVANFDYFNLPAVIPNLTYEVEVDTVNTFNSVGGNPLLDKTSNINTGFYDSTAGDTTDFKLLLETANGGGSLLLEDNTSYLILNQSFPSGDYVSYQVPSATLSNATTYYWRVRRNPSSGSYGEWSNIQSFATPANASITQVAATITFSGGTQVIGGPVSASIAQVGATLTFAGGTQTIATSNFVALSQVAATITFAGGTQAIATVNKVAIPQVAATITFAGGTQSVATVRNVAIAQLAATITFAGGTQAVATVNIVAISQSAATITFGGGTQAVTSSQKVALAQSAASLTFAGGTPAVAALQDVTVAQLAASLTFAGGTPAVLVLTNIAIAQQAASLTFSGGSPLAKGIIIVSWISPAITVFGASKTTVDVSGGKVASVSGSGKIETVQSGTKNETVQSGSKKTNITSGGLK